MNQKLLIVAITIAIMGGISMVANSVYAAPQNSTAIEASCKNNADKKEWCALQEQPAPNQDQNNTSGESNDSENNASTDGSENTTTDSDTTTLDENNTQDSSVTDNDSTEPEDATSPTIDEDNNENNTQDSSGIDNNSTEPEDTTSPTIDEDNNENNTQDSSGIDNNSTEPEDTTSPTIDEDDNESNTQGSSGIDNNSTEPEDTIPTSTEELFIQAQEAGIFTSTDATIEWLVTHGISPETLTEEQRNLLPINWNPPQLPPIITDEDESEVTPTEGANEDESEVTPAEGGDEPIESGDETIEGGDEAIETGDELIENEDRTIESGDETIENKDETVESGDETIENEINTQPIEPEDVEEPTYSPVVSEEKEQIIQTQLEAVDEVIVVDETGNETLVPIKETEVVGEVVIPAASEEEGANASINGELLNVKVELGVAEATTADEEQEPVILITVTGLEMDTATTKPSTKVNTNSLITLQLNKAGNFILRIPNLRVGDLMVNVILRALTEKLDIYQVEEVTIAPKEVFNNDDSAEVEADGNTVPATETSENIETTEPAGEEATEIVEEANS